MSGSGARQADESTVGYAARSGRRIARHPRGTLFVFGARGGTKTWRIDFPCAALLEDGEYAEAIPLAEFLRHGARRAALGLFDVCMFHRVQWSASLARAFGRVRQRGVTLVADFDDPLFSDTYAEKVLDEERAAAWSINLETAGHRAMLAAVDYCTASTDPLRDMLLAARPEHDGPVWVLPNCCSTELYTGSLACRRNRDGYDGAGTVTIGYASGSASHDADFAVVQPALERLMMRYPNVRLSIIGELEFPPFPPDAAGRIDRRELLPHGELGVALARLDVNLAPLAEGGFNECKSAIKVLEAALVGVPTVASPCAAHLEAIQHGRTGFIARSPEDWEQQLDALISDAELRRALGRAAAEHCAASYSPEVWRQAFRAARRSWRGELQFESDRCDRAPPSVGARIAAGR